MQTMKYCAKHFNDRESVSNYLNRWDKLKKSIESLKKKEIALENVLKTLQKVPQKRSNNLLLIPFIEVIILNDSGPAEEFLSSTPGTLFLIVGNSGSGKDSLIKEALANWPEIKN